MTRAWHGTSKGNGAFRKLSADPVVRLETCITQWCGCMGLGGREAEVKEWIETQHPAQFKSAVGYLDQSFSTPMRVLLARFIQHLNDLAAAQQP